MPLYEYECKQCHRRTEKRQKFSDPEITECPHCGGPIERVISAPAISFKGSGWYKDLYSSPKPAESKTSESKSDAPAASGDAAKPASGGDKASGGSAPASTAAASPAATPASPTPAASTPKS